MMRLIDPGSDWTADAVRAEVALQAALEARVAALPRGRPRSGSFRLKLLPALLALTTMLPWTVTAAEPERSSLAQRWEEVLLLDALHYLRLSPSQLQQVRVLAAEI